MSINTPQEIEKSPSCPIAPTSSLARRRSPRIVCAEDIRKLASVNSRQFLVDNLITPGVFILGGAPKRGKSLLAIDIAVSVVTGKKVGGMIPTSQCEVLFISLEETYDQLAPKLDNMAGKASLAGLFVSDQWEKAQRGGLLRLENYLAENPAIKLVIIDIWSKFQGEVKAGGRSYHGEYKTLEPVREIAKRYNVAILLLHHENKSGGKDWAKKFYGSNALTGVVDGLMLLARETPTSPDAVLHAVGRDIPAQDWNLEFDMNRICWVFGKKPLADTPEQQALLDYMTGCTGPMRLATIHKEAGAKGRSNTQKLLGKLVTANLLVKASHGTYELSPRAQHYYLSEKPVDPVDSVENGKAV